MTGSDLVVLLPWLAFGAALAVVFLLLWNSRRPPSPPGPRQSASDKTPGPAAGSAEQRTGRDHPRA